MTVTGFILWFNTLALRYFPKWVLDASAALHYYKAILATLAVLIWHMYSLVFDPDVYPHGPRSSAESRPSLYGRACCGFEREERFSSIRFDTYRDGVWLTRRRVQFIVKHCEAEPAK